MQNNHFEKDIARWVKPRNKPAKRLYKTAQKQVKSIKHMDLLDKLVLDMENHRSSVPILIKKYLQINGKLLAFNIDKDFNDVLDALMVLDVHQIPKQTLEMLEKKPDFNKD